MGKGKEGYLNIRLKNGERERMYYRGKFWLGGTQLHKGGVGRVARRKFGLRQKGLGERGLQEEKGQKLIRVERGKGEHAKPKIPEQVAPRDLHGAGSLLLGSGHPRLCRGLSTNA